MSGSVRGWTSAILVVLSSWSCSSTAPSETPDVAAIVVSPATSTLEPNAQLPLRAQVHDVSGAIVADADVTWTVQDPRIAIVSSTGVVKALAVGTTQVAANSLGKSGIAVITVSAATSTGGPANPGNDDSGTEDSSGDDSGEGTPGGGDTGAVATVTVTAPSSELTTGSTMQLTATANDDKGNPVPLQSLLWSSSNTDKATVSGTGLVAAKAPGSVTITAQTSSSGGKSGSVRIQIKKE